MENIIVMGLARTGSHSIINWICKQLSGKIYYFNNCNQDLDARNKIIYNSKENHSYNVYSLENFDLDGFKKLYGNKNFSKIIIIIRDPANWIASSLKYGGRLAKIEKPLKVGIRKSWDNKKINYVEYFCQSKSRIEMYYQYMNQVLGNFDYIGKDFIIVNYNKWFVDKNYRKEIASKIGFTFTDNGINDVVNFGFGSSFDKTKYNKKANNMKVLDRWKNYKDDLDFKKFMSDEKLIKFSKDYFNIKIN